MARTQTFICPQCGESKRLKGRREGADRRKGEMHGIDLTGGEIAERKLPEIDALLDRAARVRAWLAAATGCDCESVDDCALFDAGAPLAAAGVEAPLAIHHAGQGAAA